jgi:hypothetical protein
VKKTGIAAGTAAHVRSWALAHIFGGLKPNYKQKQCENNDATASRSAIASPEKYKFSPLQTEALKTG